MISRNTNDRKRKLAPTLLAAVGAPPPDGANVEMARAFEWRATALVSRDELRIQYRRSRSAS